MKKILLSFFVAAFVFSTYSCRQSTREKTEDALEAIGEDIETNTKKAADKVEETAKKAKDKIDEEVNDSDTNKE